MNPTKSTPARKKALITCTNVSKTYFLEDQTIPILKNVNLEIKEGEFVALIGPSGSGKSTLMHLLGLLDTPTEGTLLIEGKDVSKLSEDERADLRNEKIGFVFQQFFLLAGTSVLDNVKLPLMYVRNKKKMKSDHDTAKEMIEKVGLGHRLNYVPNQLSGGQQQRVAIARALINSPAIIFADEPTGNLDSKTGQEILALFKSLHKEGKTVILVTHDKNVANQAERIIMMVDGEIQHGNT